VDWQILAYRGECHALRGDLARSIADFSAAIQQRPDDAALHAARAMAYEQNDDLDRALADHDQVVRIAPNEPRAYFGRLNARINKGDHTGAMADMDRIVQLDPKDWGPYTYRAVLALLLLNDRERALLDLDRALAIEPRESLSYALRGYLRGGKQEFVPALRDLALCVGTLPLVEFKLLFRIDFERQRFFAGLEYGPKEPDAPAKSQRGPAVAGIHSQCIDSSIRRLAAAAWANGNRL
jgi:tetratricopeptide (TPR) repeat protein